MYYSLRNKSLVDVPQEDTRIWVCTKEGCKGWMRDNFAFEYQPVCCLCSSPMLSEIKLIASLVNSNHDVKALKRGVQIKPA